MRAIFSLFLIGGLAFGKVVPSKETFPEWDAVLQRSKVALVKSKQVMEKVDEAIRTLVTDVNGLVGPDPEAYRILTDVIEQKLPDFTPDEANALTAKTCRALSAKIETASDAQDPFIRAYQGMLLNRTPNWDNLILRVRETFSGFKDGDAPNPPSTESFFKALAKLKLNAETAKKFAKETEIRFPSGETAKLSLDPRSDTGPLDLFVEAPGFWLFGKLTLPSSVTITQIHYRGATPESPSSYLSKALEDAVASDPKGPTKNTLLACAAGVRGFGPKAISAFDKILLQAFPTYWKDGKLRYGVSDLNSISYNLHQSPEDGNSRPTYKLDFAEMWSRRTRLAEQDLAQGQTGTTPVAVKTH